MTGRAWQMRLRGLPLAQSFDREAIQIGKIKLRNFAKQAAKNRC